MTREGSSFKDVNRGGEGTCKVRGHRKAENTTEELDEYIKKQVRREIGEYLFKPLVKGLCIATGIIAASLSLSSLWGLLLFPLTGLFAYLWYKI